MTLSCLDALLAHLLTLLRIAAENSSGYTFEQQMVEQMAGDLPRSITSRLVRRAQPDWIEPMRATLTDKRFSDKDWIFEKKWDGVRALAFRKGNEIKLLSRNQLSFSGSYPEIVERLRRQRSLRFIVDGEIVAHEKGISSFSKLQQRNKAERAGRWSINYYVFDILYWNGYDTMRLPLLDRKKILRKALLFNQTIRFTQHTVGEGEAYFEKACRENWEGIIAKKADSLYVSARSRDWLKFKCSQQQEFVIVGFTDPEGARTGFGALLLGYYQNDELVYAGKVGTGYTNRLLQELSEKLCTIERPAPSVKGIGLPRNKVHWVKPELVAQISFSEWTDDGKLRHPSFLGLRKDKRPREVVREEPQ